MSAFGGDSWAREAQHRKRRLDDLIVRTVNTNTTIKDSYKKLSNGKYMCLVCSNNPVFDSSLMLSMHNKGSRHIAAESKLKDRELMQQEEINKRIALSDNSVGSTSIGTSKQWVQSKCSPLIEQTRKAASEALSNPKLEQWQNVKFDTGNSCFFSPSTSSIPGQRMGSSPKLTSGNSRVPEQSSELATKASSAGLAEQQLEFRQRRERELKFTAAGWKRDSHGKWFRDENVEFDSDEEDPNVCLS